MCVCVSEQILKCLRPQPVGGACSQPVKCQLVSQKTKVITSKRHRQHSVQHRAASFGAVASALLQLCSEVKAAAQASVDFHTKVHLYKYICIYGRYIHIFIWKKKNVYRLSIYVCTYVYIHI